MCSILPWWEEELEKDNEKQKEGNQDDTPKPAEEGDKC